MVGFPTSRATVTLWKSPLGTALLMASAMFSAAAGNGPIFRPDATAAQKAWAENLKRDAEGGPAEAQYELGRAYIEGHVFQRNVGEAVKWTRAAAAQGLAKPR
jgi:TPR repeat protein